MTEPVLNPREKYLKDVASGEFKPDEAQSAAVEELVECLAKAGLSCLSAGNGELALQLLAGGNRAKVVVSDLRMPELTGLEFAKRLGRLADGMVEFQDRRTGTKRDIAIAVKNAREVALLPFSSSTR